MIILVSLLTIFEATIIKAAGAVGEIASSLKLNQDFDFPS